MIFKKLNNNIVIYEIVRKIYYIALRQNLKVYFFVLKLILKIIFKALKLNVRQIKTK